MFRFPGKHWTSNLANFDFLLFLGKSLWSGFQRRALLDYYLHIELSKSTPESEMAAVQN